MCHGFNFYNYPRDFWFIGGIMIFKVLFAIIILALGYKIIKNLLATKAHTD